MHHNYSRPWPMFREIYSDTVRVRPSAQTHHTISSHYQVQVPYSGTSVRTTTVVRENIMSYYTDYTLLVPLTGCREIRHYRQKISFPSSKHTSRLSNEEKVSIRCRCCISQYDTWLEVQFVAKCYLSFILDLHVSTLFSSRSHLPPSWMQWDTSLLFARQVPPADLQTLIPF